MNWCRPAVTWCTPGNPQPHIIVSETMDNALQKEPRAGIAANLLSQCSQNPFLIPEQVKAGGRLRGHTTRYPYAFIPKKTWIGLDTETVVRIKNNPENVRALSPGIIVTIPR